MAFRSATAFKSRSIPLEEPGGFPFPPADLGSETSGIRASTILISESLERCGVCSGVVPGSSPDGVKRPPVEVLSPVSSAVTCK